MAPDQNTNDLTLCGVLPLLVVCPYAAYEGECFYPSNTGPCRHGIAGRRAQAERTGPDNPECRGTSGYSAHLAPWGEPLR